MGDMLTRFTRFELFELAFEPAEDKAFSRHTFTARIAWNDHVEVIHILVSRDIKVIGAHLMGEQAILEAMRSEDIPYLLVDLAITMALEHSSKQCREAFFRVANKQK